MAQLTIRNHLGTLQEDPDNEAAFEGILDLLTREGADAQADENTRLLEAARAAHLTRGEPEAAARLLAIETDLVKGDPDREAKLWAELARIREEELLDDRGAREALAHVLTLRPGDIDAQETKEKLEATEANWKSITKRFLEEAEAASDNGLKTSLLVRVGGMVWQYKKKGRDAEVDETFKKALGADPGNVRAASLYERILRRREKWAELADVLLSAANATRSRDDRVNLLVRAGRVLGHRLKDGERAAGCFAQVIDFAPGHAEAMRFLVGHFTDREEWDHLVALYEDALKGRPRHDSEQGILVQIGMVHWRMRGDLDDAEPYFARLRKSDPAHGVMLNFYRELCERTNDSPKLLGVLSDAQRAVTEPADKQRLAIEIARVAQSTPATAERAIDAWKAVQRLDPENAEAPNALKALYRSAGKWNALVEVLKAEAETTHDPEKKLGVLRELVAIFRDRLQLDVMVINTYNAILQIEPRDPEALATLAKTYEAVGRWNDLIQVLARQAEAEEDGPHKVEILTRVAALWIERFANYNKATGPLEQVLSIDPHNRSALGLLKDIYTKRRSWQPLFEVLKKELDLVDGQTKRDLYVEMARIAAERLDKHGEAIELWRHALELDPTTPGALDAMERLAERQKDWPTLADILERRVAEAEDDKRRIELLQKLGQVAQDRLADPARAARAWRQILQIDPKNGRAMRVLRELYLAARDWESLELLYAEQNDWEGLVEVLGQAADKAEDPALKVQLSFRTAELYEKEIGEPHRAFRSYERVLGVEPGNERAIRALIPIYEKEQHGAKLPALYDALFGVVSKREGTTEEQLALLEKLRTVVLDQLSDAKRAMRYAGAAYELAPKDDAVRQSLERTADRANAWPDVSAAYELRMESSDDPEEVLALRRRVADIASDRLGSPEKAVEQLKAILAARPDDSDATTALDRIYRSTGRAADLRDLYAHRLARATDPADRYFLLSDLAKVEEDQLEDPDAASSRYRAILEIEPSDQDALAALERLSTTASRWTELRDVLAKRRELASGDERIELGFRLGQLYADKLADPKAALDEHAQVLAAKPGHPGAVAALERVLLHPELGLAAARMLEPELERAGNHAKLARTLEILLDSEESPDAKRSLRMRLADLRLHHLGDASGAFDVLASALRDAPGDEELWAQLGAAAGGAGTYAELAAAYTAALDSGSLSPDATTMLCARIAEIHEDHLASPKDAEPFHKRAIAIDPLAERPFLSLKRLYTDSERWEELQALYRNRIAQTVDAEAKLGLLMQVCFLFEEILDDPEAAIRAYQDVLEMAPDHEVSRRALERLFLRTERWRDLAALLTLELSTAQGNDLVELRYRLGELHESKLDDAAAAVDQYAEVLALSPRYLRAQEALERLLASASQRQRVASILEPLYESQGAWSELARVLEVQLEDVRDPGSRVGLLLRIAEIREQRLRDDGAAADAHGRAVLADPSDPRPRSELARIARAKGTERMRASILEQAIAATQTDPSLVAGLLRELAVLWDESVGDTTEAEKAYRRLLTVDGDNPESALPAARALERIYLGTGDNRALVETLRLQVRFEEDPDRRRRLRVRLADVLEQALGDVDGALAAHRDRLEAEPTDIDAMIALERLYEQKERYTDLIGVLRQRDAVTNDAATRLEIAQRIAGTYDEKLQSRDDAIVGYNEVLELARGQTGGVAEDARRKAIAALERLYADAGKWHDLVEVLELEHGLAHDSHDRAEVRFRIAETRRERIGDAAKAIEEYEEVLRQVHDHKGARAALELLLEDDNHRVAAARVIAPFYEVESNYAKLLSALDVVATHGEDPAERLDALKRGADVAEIGLNEPVRAFDLMARAVRLAAAEPDLRQLVDNLERLASAANRHGELMSLLREIAPDVLDGDLAVDLLGKVAHLARFKVGDLDLAREHYVRVLEQRPDDRRALDALEELYADASDHRALLDVLRKKADLASDPSARRRLLVAQAQLCEGPLADAPAAIVAYESVLEEGVDREAMLALERLYASSERWDDLANLLQRELDGNVGKPVDIRHRLGVVAIDHQSDTLRGIEHLRAALALDANHTESTAKLESLIEDPDYRAVVGETLEPIYLARMDWANVVRALEARISAESDTQAKKQLLVRLGGVKEEQLEDLDGALETYARLFREEITDTQVWDTLQRLTRVLTAWPRLADIFAGALEDVVSDEPTTAKLAVLTARICEEHTKDYERATKLYRRALAFDPRDTEAFTALERVHRVTESWEALLELYREAAASAPDPAEQKSHLAKRAAVFEQLARLDDAVGVHREILEVDPTDRPAMEAIDRLLVATSRWSDLAEHLRFRIEDASDVASKNGLRFRLGNVLEEKLEDASGAVDAYEQILESDPGHADAIAALEILVQDVDHRLRITHILEPVYRRGDQWRKLIAIYEAQVELASDASEKVRLLREIAGLHEKRGQQKTLAFHAWARAYVEEPGDDDARGHLERLAADLGAWDDLVDTFEQAIEKTFDQALKASLLTAVARVHDEQRGDPRKAIDAYERLLAADETDASPLEALEGLHTLLADWAGLVKVLERKVERATDPVDHGDLLRRMGSIQEELLADVPGAIDSYRRAVDVDGSDSVALEALDRLYGQTGDHASLGPVLRRRMETTSSDPDLQVELGLRLGELAATELRDTREAIDAYTQVLAIRGDEVAAVGALTKLYEQERMWPELLSNLALAAALAQSDAERVIIKHRIGEIHEKELSDLAAALETYADVLAIDGDHAPTLDALSGIARDEEFRGQAASLLEPRYRTAGRWDDLAKLLELVIDGTSDPELRARELSKLALVHEDGRKDLDAAFGALLRALADRPSDEALVAELERLAARLRTWDRLADALGAAGASAMDPRSARSLYLRLARISENELKDDARAIEALKRAADATGDDDEILAMLDRLFTKTSSWVDLADVLERRIGLDPARQPSERAELLCRLGRIRLEQFHDKSSALSSFREVLERDPHHGAALTAVEGLLDDPDVAPDVVDALDAAYRETASLEKLAALYDTRVKLATTGADRIAFLREQAELYESRLGNQAGALSALKRATREEPGEEGVFKDLERLAGAMGREGWTALSGFVEQVLEEKGESLDPAQVRDLHLRAARWYRDHIGDSALAEAQLRAAIERDRDSSDAHSELADLLRASGQHRPLVEALRDWARVELDADARRKRLRNAAALAEDQLGDRALAGEALSQILDDDESDGQALEELARIREAEGRFAEVADLLERRARVADDPAARVSLYHRVAGIAIGKLEDSDRAVTAYENVLTEDPGDLAAIGALERIHEASARWKDLRDVITRRLENATTAEDRIAARVRLARLAEERFGQRDDAIEQLREILAEDSRNALAADELERLYAVAKRWSDLTDLLEQRAGDAASIGDLDGELSALVRLGEVYQTRLNDDARAVEIYERVLSRQPKHPSALAAVARLHEKAGDWAKAAEALDTALGLAKPGKDGAALALRLAEIQNGKLKDAAASEATLYKALDLDPTASEPAVILMERYERAGEHAKLAKILSFEEERTEAPDAKVALLRRIAALAADKLDDPARAADALERATKLAPDNREVLLPLCDLYIRAGRQADAVPVLQKIIASYGGRRAKELATYHHRLGQALEGMGDQAAALEQYDAAFRIDLTSVPVLRDLGRLKYKAGDVDGAQKAFRALLLQKFDASSGISKADVYFYLGDMSSKSGDKAKAISMLERSIAEDKEHANARALLRELKGQ